MYVKKGFSDVTTATDTELILQSQHGNMDAFEQLIQRYDKRVFTIAAGYVHSAEDAKDIYQEVFMRVYRGLPKFESRSEFGTWLYRITTNVCLTYRARRRREPSVFGRDHDTEEAHGAHPSLNDETSARRMGEDDEISRRVEKALDRLSPRQRLVFTLRHYDGRKLAEIATMLGCSVGTVKKYLFEATARLRGQLKDLMI
jgi:RNA polymerase sigma-70 factor (ECF subfamily)